MKVILSDYNNKWKYKTRHFLENSRIVENLVIGSLSHWVTQFICFQWKALLFFQGQQSIFHGEGFFSFSYGWLSMVDTAKMSLGVVWFLFMTRAHWKWLWWSKGNMVQVGPIPVARLDLRRECVEDWKVAGGLQVFQHAVWGETALRE